MTIAFAALAWCGSIIAMCSLTRYVVDKITNSSQAYKDVYAAYCHLYYSQQQQEQQATTRAAFTATDLLPVVPAYTINTDTASSPLFDDTVRTLVLAQVP